MLQVWTKIVKQDALKSEETGQGEDMITLVKRTVPKPLYSNLRRYVRSAIGFARKWQSRDGIVTLRGLRLDISHPQVSDRIRLHILRGSYESHEARLISKYLRRGDRVLELGAGMGYATMLSARIVGGQSVFAYEANPALEVLLKRNFELNGLSPNLEIALLGESDGSETFYVTDDFFSSSSIPEMGGTPIEVPRKDINSVLAQHRPNVLIVDIEGGEVNLSKIVNSDNIRLLIIECHPSMVGFSEIQEMINRFEEQGFRSRRYGDEGAVFQYVGEK